MPFPHIVAHTILNVVPPDPWHYLSGESNVIAVDSHATHQYFLKSGIEKSQMQVTGSLLQDTIASIKSSKDTKSTEFLKQSKLDIENQFFDRWMSKSIWITDCMCEFNEMAEVSVVLRKALNPLTEKFNIVIRPHPNFFEFGDLLESDKFFI